MVDKLLITYHINGEVARQQRFEVVFNVQNIGKMNFSGAKIVALELVIDSYKQSQTVSELVPLPALAPEESTKISVKFSPQSSGLGWFILKLDPVEKGTVECYQSRTGYVAGENNWRNSIYIADPDTKEIIELLKEIRDRLKN